jgi:5-formyltetrahydrofolate cyclo-ligase
MSAAPDPKTAARRAALARRSALSPAVRAAGSRRAAERLAALPDYRAAKTVLLYASHGAELDTFSLIEAALAAGKGVALPVDLGGGRMEAAFVTDLQVLRPGPRGILEPAGPFADPALFDFAVVPAVAADHAGVRLGYGGGYYDRYLPRLRSDAARAGLIFECQLVPGLPWEPHDSVLPLWITEERMFCP